MSHFTRKALMIVAATIALVTVIHLWRRQNTQMGSMSTWTEHTWNKDREAPVISAPTIAGSAVNANARSTVPALGIASAVHVFAPAQIGCQFPLPVNIPGKGMSKMCTYDPAVDREISGHIKNAQTLYSASDIQIMLEIMRADNNANPHYNKALEGKSGISLVDVGCNIGLFTLSGALNGYRVLSVDAMNSSLQLLATSLTFYNATPMVTLVHNAISDAHRDVILQVRLPNNIGASWVLQSSPDRNNNTAAVYTEAVVKAVCLDDLLPYVSTRRVFLKMDIEGSEWRALRCASRFFSELDIPYFHMEWAFYMLHLKEQGPEIVSFLTSRGYLPYNPGTGGAPLSLANPTAAWPGNVLWKKTLSPKA